MSGRRLRPNKIVASGSSYNSEAVESDLPGDYFVKGPRNQKKSEDDIMIIKDEDGPISINRVVLRKTLIDLREKSGTIAHELQGEDAELLAGVKKTLNKVYPHNKYYKMVVEDIKDIFSTVNKVDPGTVGAYFIGCFREDNFTGPKGCNPLCVGSLKPTGGMPGHNDCDDMVLLYENDTFMSQNDKKSEHAYVYIKDDNFRGFTKVNIAQLEHSGITSCSFLYSNGEGGYREVTDPVPIKSLPFRTNFSGDRDVDAEDSEEVPGWSAVVAILVVLLVILLFVLLYQLYIHYVGPLWV